MEFNWIGSKRANNNIGGGTANYEVRVSVVKDNKKSKQRTEEWQKYRINITFGTRAFNFLKEEGYMWALRTPIASNSEREWLKFIKGDDSQGGVKLSLTNSKKQYVASYLFYDKAEYEVVKKMWQRTYSLKYDNKEKTYYIDGVNPILYQDRWI